MVYLFVYNLYTSLHEYYFFPPSWVLSESDRISIPIKKFYFKRLILFIFLSLDTSFILILFYLQEISFRVYSIFWESLMMNPSNGWKSNNPTKWSFESSSYNSVWWTPPLRNQVHSNTFRFRAPSWQQQPGGLSEA